VGGWKFTWPYFRIAKILYQLQTAFQDETGDKDSGFEHILMLSYEHASAESFWTSSLRAMPEGGRITRILQLQSMPLTQAKL